MHASRPRRLPRLRAPHGERHAERQRDGAHPPVQPGAEGRGAAALAIVPCSPLDRPAPARAILPPRRHRGHPADPPAAASRPAVEPARPTPPPSRRHPRAGRHDATARPGLALPDGRPGASGRPARRLPAGGVTTAAPHVLELLRDGVPGDADREQVLDAALEAFLDFGIRRTSMGEIARRSGLSPATLYRRFPGKDRIVWAVGLREAVRLVERVDAEVDPATSAEEQIVALSVACMREMRANALLRRLLAIEPEILLPLLTIRGGPVLDLGRAYVGEVIRRLAEREGVAALDTEQVDERPA